MLCLVVQDSRMCKCVSVRDVCIAVVLYSGHRYMDLGATWVRTHVFSQQ